MRYSDAIWRPSSCFSPGKGRKPSFVVLHITDGSPSVQNAAERFAASKAGVSPHFLVGQAGEIYQFVQLEDSAWHAKGWNSNSIGIEHVARSPGELKQWASLSERTRRSLVPKDAPIDGATDPGFPLTEAQLAASARLVAWLCFTFDWAVDRRAIRPHCENPQTTHSDCGRDWPWDSYLAAVSDRLLELRNVRGGEGSSDRRSGSAATCEEDGDAGQ